MDCDRTRDSLEAFALGALDPAEQEAIELHLADCDDCRRLAAAYAEVAHALPQALAAVSPATPPPALKDRLLASIGGTSPRQGARARAAHPGPSGRPSPLGRPQGWPWWSRARALAALAAVLLVAASLTWGVRLSQALERERSLRAEFAALVGQQEVVLEVIDSDQTVKRLLRPARPDAAATRAYGKVFTRTDLAHVVAMAARLPQPPPGQSYHLWLTTAGRTELAGTMTLDDKGFALLVFDAPQTGPTYEAAFLTLQPPGDAPLGEPVIRWDAAAT